jgi:hypothetical protein
MSQSGRPLLRNVCHNNAYFSGNGIKTSSVSAETNTLITAASETVKLKNSTWRLFDRPADGYNREIQTEAVVAGATNDIRCIYIHLITCKMQIVHTDNRLITADCDSRKRQTRPVPHQQILNCLTVIKSGRKPQMDALFQVRLAD